MKKSFLIRFVFGAGIVLGIVNPASSQDIQPVITPNAMIILDTSYSMNYRNDGSYPGASNVTVDLQGYRLKDENNKTDADYKDPGTNYKFEGGGDHPFSKLYQGKLALKKVINNLEGINLGFSTYAQSKTENRRGKYERMEQHWSGPLKTTCTWSRLYFKFQNSEGPHWTSVTAPPPKGTFTFDGTVYTGMDVGSKVKLKNHTFDKKTVPPHPPGTYKDDLEYSISSVVTNPELNTYTYNLTSTSHYHYTPYTFYYSVTTDDSNCNEVKKSFVCDSDSTFPKIHKTYPDYKTYWAEDRVGDKYPEDGSSVMPKTKWDCSGPSKTDKGSFGVVHKNYAWGTFAGTVCPDTTGSAYNWDGAKAITEGSDGYSVYSAVDKVKLCYDVSDYNYPALGDTDNPDIWSYYRITGGKWPSYLVPNYPSRDDKRQPE